MKCEITAIYNRANRKKRKPPKMMLQLDFHLPGKFFSKIHGQKRPIYHEEKQHHPGVLLQAVLSQRKLL